MVECIELGNGVELNLRSSDGRFWEIASCYQRRKLIRETKVGILPGFLGNHRVNLPSGWGRRFDSIQDARSFVETATQS
jgi:hypothetical protein